MILSWITAAQNCLAVIFNSCRIGKVAADGAKLEEDFIAAASFLKSHELSTGMIGAVGFCYGGYIVNMLAAVMPDALND